jgi:hypothetical protein
MPRALAWGLDGVENASDAIECLELRPLVVGFLEVKTEREVELDAGV